MQIIKNLIFKIQYIINSFYYYKSSVLRNIYPCKLIGEKINSSEAVKIIVYKILGQSALKEISLKKLLSQKKLIEKFHPEDALKLGCMALKEAVLELKESDWKKIFNEIKNIMLNSTHDVSPNIQFQNIHFASELAESKADCADESLDSILVDNIYPFKLVGGKTTNKNETMITFTIYGKREGHEKLLKELTANSNLLEKFHPTEAVKFGFISQGDFLFGIPEVEMRDAVNELKDLISIA